MIIQESRYALNIESPVKNSLLIKIEGNPLKKDVIEVLNEITARISDLKAGYVIYDLKHLESFPWLSRIKIFEAINKLYKEGYIAHSFLISPNATLKTVAHFSTKLFPNNSFSVHYTVENAIDSIKIETESEGHAKAFYIRSVFFDEVDDSKSIFFKKTFMTDNEGNKAIVGIIEPNIFILHFKGLLSDTIANFCFDYLDKHLWKKENHWNLIVDASQLRGISRNGRKVFSSRRDWLATYVSKRFYALNRPMRALFKSFSLINREFRNTSVVVDDIFITADQLIKNGKAKAIEYQNQLKGQLHKKPSLSRENLENLSKDELINIIQSSEKEHNTYRDRVVHDSKLVMEIISKITWNDESFVSPLELENVLPEFYDLFQNINRLQFEAADLIQELESHNDNLNKLVDERTTQIEAKSSNLNSLLESYNAPIWIIDTGYRIVSVNSFFEAIVKNGYGTELKVGERIIDYFTDEIKTFWKEKYDSALAGKVVEFHQDYNMGGEIGVYVYKVFPVINDEKIIGCGVIGNNITKLVNSEIQLKEQNETLTKLNEELDTFIYRSSHDMRAPIATLLGLLDLVKNEKDDEKRNQCFSFMEESISKLDGFIHEITELTKNSKYEIESVNLNLRSFVNNILSELAYMPNYSIVKLELDISESIQINSDSFRLKTILKNLIANSIKYSRANSNSWVKVNAKKQEDKIEIVIADNGQGIAKDQHKKVFNMFHRANLSSKGSGLGLYIVKETVHKLGGSINLESELGKGTSVSVIL
ncbi:MAG: PAS domain-containing sensor histidine kinase [Bacteroidia bacterium]